MTPNYTIPPRLPGGSIGSIFPPDGLFTRYEYFTNKPLTEPINTMPGDSSEVKIESDHGTKRKRTDRTGNFYDTLNLEPSYLQTRATSAIEMFRDIQEGKILGTKLPSTPLEGPSNYMAWYVNIKLSLRQHGVWPVISGLERLDEGHPLYVWYERMIYHAMTLIWLSVSDGFKEQYPHFGEALMHDGGPDWDHSGDPGLALTLIGDVCRNPDYTRDGRNDLNEDEDDDRSGL
ncbi:hypothetical protein N7467_000483 [Penicillium canescens]|nr:hypothetical protein N7467_000483 [Penicillium canescens]